MENKIDIVKRKPTNENKSVQKIGNTTEKWSNVGDKNVKGEVRNCRT